MSTRPSSSTLVARRTSTPNFRSLSVAGQVKALAAVELRSWDETDADSLRQAVGSSKALRSQFGDRDLASGDYAAVIRRHLAVSLPSLQNFAISVAGRAVGNVGVSHMEHRHDTGWVYYWLAADVRGLGLATRAVASAARWAFVERDIFRLELGHDLTNSPSCRVALRSGFASEGIERLKLKQGRNRVDVETHARLRTDPSPAVKLLLIS